LNPETKHQFQDGSVFIEAMVLVTIIVIIVGLLLPNVFVRFQKEKSKGTLQDIHLIARACLEYIDEQGTAPASGMQSGPLREGSAFIDALENGYLTDCPTKDRWGNPLFVYSGQAGADFNDLTEDLVGNREFVIVSYGRDGKAEGFKYDPAHPQSGWYELDSVDDFDKDFINWKGNWIRRPKPH
jgi:type II secretory pathway pseudopilin PulG